eukprot:TRINITY_DN64224_c0_g1_i2.p1 TRINITY_DN64224_c0_g1~~TRINITY_DN64224_c0_g1_i2.p1  ORF type:complete len:427 (-),score=40.37 TRINITY_DN64224_c0_g1_i2:73-1353(-)
MRFPFVRSLRSLCSSVAGHSQYSPTSTTYSLDPPQRAPVQPSAPVLPEIDIERMSCYLLGAFPLEEGDQLHSDWLDIAILSVREQHRWLKRQFGEHYMDYVAAAMRSPEKPVLRCQTGLHPPKKMDSHVKLPEESTFLVGTVPHLRDVVPLQTQEMWWAILEVAAAGRGGTLRIASLHLHDHVALFQGKGSLGRQITKALATNSELKVVFLCDSEKPFTETFYNWWLDNQHLPNLTLARVRAFRTGNFHMNILTYCPDDTTTEHCQPEEETEEMKKIIPIGYIGSATLTWNAIQNSYEAGVGTTCPRLVREANTMFDSWQNIASPSKLLGTTKMTPVEAEVRVRPKGSTLWVAIDSAADNRLQLVEEIQQLWKDEKEMDIVVNTLSYRDPNDGEWMLVTERQFQKLHAHAVPYIEFEFEPATGADR